jgi:multidrug efflux pump subunit AcrA (membrane-fusion protein)
MRQYHGLTAEMYRAVVAVMDERLEKIQVNRQDYERLVQAQMRVEGRMDRVEAALERLAQAQTRTEERVARLEEGQIALQKGQASLEAALERLAQAQTRTEERAARLEEGQVALQMAVERLVQAQARTELRIEELAQAQARTEARMEQLVQAQARTNATVAGLGEIMGFTLEDVARLMLPPYLQRHYGVHLEGPAGDELGRRFFPMKDRPDDEINLYGEGWRDGQRVVVLGESKARIGGSVVSDFVQVLKRVEPLVTGEVWRVMFGYYIHPSAQPVAEENKVLLVASYQR